MNGIALFEAAVVGSNAVAYGLIAAALLIGAGAAALLLGLWLRARRARTSPARRMNDEKLIGLVREKALRATEAEEETQLVTSEEGKDAVLAIINGLIARRYYEQGIKWAQQAHAALPGHPEFGLKLAELYYRSGDTERFVEIARELHAGLHGPYRRHWRAVVGMGRALAPQHALFRTAAECADTPVHRFA